MNKSYTSAKTSFITILKWQLSKRFTKKGKLAGTLLMHHHDNLPAGEYALWLGHASIWLRCANTSIIIDPVLGNIPMYKRLIPLPIPQEQLRADVILLTHAHYDHFDKPSVIKLLNNNPDTIIIAPTGFWRYLKGHIAKEKYFELKWWESVTIGEVVFTLTPSKHWSKRTLFDTNKALWGGYIIQDAHHCIYHSGDTAMGDHFREIGERFEITEAFLPIGAYRPEVIMKDNHTNPPEALEACSLLGAKILIPIHYGTFLLSDEPLNEPLEWFSALVNTKNYPFKPKVLGIGEIYRFRTTSTFTST